MTDPNLLNEVARIIDPDGFAALDKYGLTDRLAERLDLALSKASQVLVLVEGWSTSSQSQPISDALRATTEGEEPSVAVKP